MLQEFEDQLVDPINVFFRGAVTDSGQQHFLPKPGKVRLELIIKTTDWCKLEGRVSGATNEKARLAHQSAIEKGRDLPVPVAAAVVVQGTSETGIRTRCFMTRAR